MKRYSLSRLFCLFLMSVMLFMTSCGGSSAPYTEDEHLRLNLTTNTILDLMEKGAYRDIYTNHTSTIFRSEISQDEFLRMSLCMEKQMGPIKSHRKGPYQYKRAEGTPAIHNVSIHTMRDHGASTLHMSFVQEDLFYTLKAITWDTGGKTFQRCVRYALKNREEK